MWVKHICNFSTDWLPEDLFSSSSSAPIRINKHTHQNSRCTHVFHYTAEQLTLSLQLPSLSSQSLPIIQPTPAILAANHSNWGNEMLGQVDRAKTNTAEDGCICELQSGAACSIWGWNLLMNFKFMFAKSHWRGRWRDSLLHQQPTYTRCYSLLFFFFFTVLMRHHVYQIRHQHTHSHEEYTDYQDLWGFMESSADQI